MLPVDRAPKREEPSAPGAAPAQEHGKPNAGPNAPAPRGNYRKMLDDATNHILDQVWRVVKNKQQIAVKEGEGAGGDSWMVSGRNGVQLPFLLAACREHRFVSEFFGKHLAGEPKKAREVGGAEGRMKMFYHRLADLEREMHAEIELQELTEADERAKKAIKDAEEKKKAEAERMKRAAVGKGVYSPPPNRPVRARRRSQSGENMGDGQRQRRRSQSNELSEAMKVKDNGGWRRSTDGPVFLSPDSSPTPDKQQAMQNGNPAQQGQPGGQDGFGATGGGGIGMMGDMMQSPQKKIVIPPPLPQARAASPKTMARAQAQRLGVKRETAASLERKAVAMELRRSADTKIQMLTEAAALVPRPDKGELARPTTPGKVARLINTEREKMGFVPIDEGRVVQHVQRRASRLPGLSESRSMPGLMAMTPIFEGKGAPLIIE